VNLLDNGISIDQALVLTSIFKVNAILKSLCGNSGHETELGMNGKNISAAEATMLAAEIACNGALKKFDISSNDIRAEGGKALAAGLQGNQVITELNISDNKLGFNHNADRDISGIIAIADAIPNMGALTSLDVSTNDIGRIDIFPDGWTSKDNDGRAHFVHADGRRQDAIPDGAKSSGVIALANAIPDMGALSHFDISNSELYAAGTKSIAEGLKGNQVMTELNISGNSMGKISKWRGSLDLSGVAALADVIPGMGALSVLNLAENNLGQLVLPEGWTEDCASDEDEEVYKHADGREQKDNPGKPEGIIAIANAILDMSAMTSLNLASNELGVEGAKIIAACLPKCT
jgi:hypothetical protein